MRIDIRTASAADQVCLVLRAQMSSITVDQTVRPSAMSVGSDLDLMSDLNSTALSLESLIGTNTS